MRPTITSCTAHSCLWQILCIPTDEAFTRDRFTEVMCILRQTNPSANRNLDRWVFCLFSAPNLYLPHWASASWPSQSVRMSERRLKPSHRVLHYLLLVVTVDERVVSSRFQQCFLCKCLCGIAGKVSCRAISLVRRGPQLWTVPSVQFCDIDVKAVRTLSCTDSDGYAQRYQACADERCITQFLLAGPQHWCLSFFISRIPLSSCTKYYHIFTWKFLCALFTHTQSSTEMLMGVERTVTSCHWLLLGKNH